MGSNRLVLARFVLIALLGALCAYSLVWVSQNSPHRFWIIFVGQVLVGAALIVVITRLTTPRTPTR